MMIKRKFLLPFTALATALSVTSFPANAEEPYIAADNSSLNHSVLSDSANTFNFILKRADEQMILGAHRSHSSHSSHRSHYSSRY